jgi:hypothetical protein
MNVENIFSEKCGRTMARTIGRKPYLEANAYMAVYYSKTSTILDLFAGILAATSGEGSYSDLGMDMLDSLEILEKRAAELDLKFINNTKIR